MNKLESLDDFRCNLRSGTLGKRKNMQTTVHYLLICNRAVRDMGTGLFTYVDTFGQIIIPKDNDSATQSFWIGGSIYSSIGGDVSLELRIEFPDGTQSVPSIIKGNISPGDVGLSTYLPLVKFTQIGMHYLKAKFQGMELETGNRFFFEVKKQE